MKRIEAHLNPFRLDEVLEALVESGLGPMTITDTLACTLARRRRRARRGAAFAESSTPQSNLEIVLPDPLVREAVYVISFAAGPNPEGSLFISPVETVIDIQTGEIST
jgi:nitrogen regulatory protein P-II 1